MISINVNVVGEEALVRLDTLPRRLRAFLETKLDAFLIGPARERLFLEAPGKYLDPQYVQADVRTVGDLLVGSLEIGDKPGVYEFGTKTAPALAFRAKSGDWVVVKRVYNHPYMKGGPIAERYFRENKPWLIDEIEDIIFDAVYNAR